MVSAHRNLSYGCACCACARADRMLADYQQTSSGEEKENIAHRIIHEIVQHSGKVAAEQSEAEKRMHERKATTERDSEST